MKAFIEIKPSIKENQLPVIRLSKSRKGDTGTATFLFIKPKIFKEAQACNFVIKSIRLVHGNKNILSQHIKIIFRNGKPFVLKGVFIFSTRIQYIAFLNFIFLYAYQNKLTYSKIFKNSL